MTCKEHDLFFLFKLLHYALLHFALKKLLHFELKSCYISR